MDKVFYETFERHAHGEGIKGKSTHYCSGCGHGIIHNYVADAIKELDIQDRTVAVSPVGCAVFLYYYFDVGNTQAAHGRAPAVAIGHKMANPNSVVISYQGDGDLASIGLAEIFQAAQMGLPISVIFVNNAVYAMTGGQLAPTTLMNMKTATTPGGRTRMMGEPLKMAEVIAQLDGPVYVERVALFDNKQRTRARKAVKKAIQLQVENRGFSFVEILAECPTHLKLTPDESQEWVRENMVPIFPLGLKKEVPTEPWFSVNPPDYHPENLIQCVGGRSETEASPIYSKGFPKHLNPENIALKLAGAGGDGAQTAAMLLTHTAINEGFDATYIPSYGPESRGGTSYADVRIAEEEVVSPAANEPHILVAFNSPSLAKFAPRVRSDGMILYDSSLISEVPEVGQHVRMYGIPFAEIAQKLGKVMVKNVVALGALQAATDLFPEDAFLGALRDSLRRKCALIPLNEEAFEWGQKKLRESLA